MVPIISTLTDILTAVVALGALFAAIWAARVSKKLYDVEASRDLVAMLRAEKDQASGIAAWCVFSPANEAGSQNGLLLHNSSDAPVFDVEVWSTYARKQNLPPEPQSPLKLALLPPGDYVANEDPTYHWSFPEPRDSIEGTVRPVTKNASWIVTNVHFTDAHGTRWSRRGGQLTKHSSAVH